MKKIAILRGINVSGQKKIKMADLKALFESLGFTGVVTYIQSGNVIFESSVSDGQELIKTIEQAITKQYGFEVPVLTRTKENISQIIKECPFGEVDLAVDGTKVLLTMLAEIPNEENIQKLMNYVKPPEELIVMSRDVYVKCPNGYGRSKLSNVFIENKLKVQATTRNWKTIHKLNELSQS